MNITNKFFSICRKNVLTDIEQYHADHNGQIAEVSLFTAMSNKNVTISVFKFLLSHVRDKKNMCALIIKLCKNNRLDLMEELVETYYINANYSKIIEYATTLKYYDIVLWASMQPRYIDIATITRAAIYSDCNTFQKLTNIRGHLNTNIIVQAINSDVEWQLKLTWYKHVYKADIFTIGKLINICAKERCEEIIENFSDFIEDNCNELVKLIHKIPQLMQFANKFNMNIDEQLSKLKCDDFSIVADFYKNDKEMYQLLLNNYALHNKAIMIKSFLEWCEDQSITLDSTVVIEMIKKNKLRLNTHHDNWIMDHFNIERININGNAIIVTNETKKRKREEDTCCICLEEANAYTTCDHNVCTSCLQQLTKNSCPICRANISNITKYQHVIKID